MLLFQVSGVKRMLMQSFWWWVTYTHCLVWKTGKIARGPGEQKARAMGSSSTTRKQMHRRSWSFMWGDWSPEKSGGFVQAEIVLGWGCRIRLNTHMLLAAAKVMTERVGTSALGEVTPGGHCIDIGTWSFDRSPIRNFILWVTCLLTASW